MWPAVKRWAVAVRQKHARMLLSHPHHYVTALGLTGLLFISGHWEAGGVVGAWGYALIENLIDAGD